MDRLRPKLPWLAWAAAALALAGCGAGASAQTTPQPITFPDLGYRYIPPQIQAGVPHGSVLLVDLENIGRAQPASMPVDSDATFSDASWSSWGAPTTIAHGKATVRICDPDCGGGYNATYPATLVLSHLRSCRSYRFYETATMTLATVDGPRPWGAYLKDPCSS